MTFLCGHAGKNAEIAPLPAEEIAPLKLLQIALLSSEENDPHWKCLN